MVDTGRDCRPLVGASSGGGCSSCNAAATALGRLLRAEPGSGRSVTMPTGHGGRPVAQAQASALGYSGWVG